MYLNPSEVTFQTWWEEEWKTATWERGSELIASLRPISGILRLKALICALDVTSDSLCYRLIILEIKMLDGNSHLPINFHLANLLYRYLKNDSLAEVIVDCLPRWEDSWGNILDQRMSGSLRKKISTQLF